MASELVEVSTLHKELAAASTPLAPVNENSASEIVRMAAEQGQRIRITGCCAGAALKHTSVQVVETHKLTGVACYAPENFTVAVRSGTPLQELEQTLAAQGQRLPFEVRDWQTLFPERGFSSIGGTVAGQRGMIRGCQGHAISDHLLAVRLVNGLGQIVTSGASTQKNAAGLDWMRLLVASRGRLGMLTEVSFRVETIPDTETTLIVGLSLDRLSECVARLRAAGLGGASIAHLNKAAGEALGLRSTLQKDSAMVRIEGSFSAVHRRRDLAIQVLGTPKLPPKDGIESAALWRSIVNLSAFSDTHAPLWSIRMRPGQPLDFLNHPAFSDCRIQVDNGGCQAWISLPDNVGAASSMALHIVNSGAALYVARGSLPISIPVTTSPRLRQLRHALHRSFDPHGVFDTSIDEVSLLPQELL